MPRLRNWPSQFVSVFVLLGAFVLAPTDGSAARIPPDQLRRDALEYERLGQWDRECEVYIKLLAEDRYQPELRERLQQCVRHLHQVRRHRDPVFRSKILSLSMAQALDVYVAVLVKLNAQYVDRDKVPLDRLYLNGLDEFRAALADPTFRQEYLAAVDPAALANLQDQVRESWSAQAILETRDARRAVRDLAWEVQRLIGLNPTVVIMEFACGACNALDEYTVFLTPGQPLDDPTALSGDLAAYGLIVNWRDRQLVVERVLPDTWATDQGLKPGDRVTHIGRGGTTLPLDRMPPEAVVDLLRGDAGTITELTIWPTGAMTGRVLVLPPFAPSVVAEEVRADGIGYIRLANFQKTTPQEMESAVLSLRSRGLRVLILDLRGNPGGLFPAAVQVADRFLPPGVIVTSTQGQLRGVSKQYVAQSPLTAIDVPLVVLVDGDTASAAEVVAGALKDNQRALLIGQTTYGKGSIQSLVPLQVGGGIRLTLARFYTPRGQPFAGLGVAPHLFEPRRDLMRDYQLELAIEHAARLVTMK